MSYGFGRQNYKYYLSDRRGKYNKSWIAPRLLKRVRVLYPYHNQGSSGILSRLYLVLRTVGGSCTPVSENSRVRFSSTEKFDSITHRFEFRKSAFHGFGAEFSKAFSVAFDTVEDLMPLTDSFYLMVKQGSDTKGRIFRVRGSMDVGEKREMFAVLAEEVECRGTGISGSGPLDETDSVRDYLTSLGDNLSFGDDELYILDFD
jgi:hypothetical protein